MDPAIIAALIAVPTSVVAATAAYAAGRAQARGAHRGPVDAVRRESQRDAYLAFTTAARLDRGNRNLVDLQALRDACDVVEVEGPTHITILARHVVARAESYDSIARSYPPWLFPTTRTATLAYRLIARQVYFHARRTNRDALDAAVEEFKTAARDHLNDSGR